MTVQNRTSGRFEAIDIGDILYSYCEIEPKSWERQATWSFKCQGLLKTADETYILGPGDQLFLLGLNCFTNATECRDRKYNMKRNKIKPEERYKVALMKISEDEMIKI